MVTTVSAVCFMFVWTIFLISYIVYRRTRKEKAAASKEDWEKNREFYVGAMRAAKQADKQQAKGR